MPCAAAGAEEGSAFSANTAAATARGGTAVAPYWTAAHFGSAHCDAAAMAVPSALLAAIDAAAL